MAYHRLRLPMWAHGDYHIATPHAGQPVGDCMPSQICILPSFEVVGLAEYNQAAKWDHSTEDHKLQLSAIALAAAAAGVLVLPSRAPAQDAPSSPPSPYHRDRGADESNRRAPEEKEGDGEAEKEGGEMDDDSSDYAPMDVINVED